jgi:hypothetical protein
MTPWHHLMPAASSGGDVFTLSVAYCCLAPYIISRLRCGECSVFLGSGCPKRLRTLLMYPFIVVQHVCAV